MVFVFFQVSFKENNWILKAASAFNLLCSVVLVQTYEGKLISQKMELDKGIFS